MQIGILGGTGPAGSALGLRLASIGCDVLLGSRDAQRAVGICAELVRKFGDVADTKADAAIAVRKDDEALRQRLRLRVRAPYQVADMAADALGVLDAALADALS